MGNQFGKPKKLNFKLNIMKTKLLFTLSLLISALGFSQAFDNIPTGSGIYINKLIPSPSGDDLINEYIEIRGTANAIIPADLYLITIEGDGNSSSRGKVSEAISLGDGTRTFGTNGMLAVICNYTQDSGGKTDLENLDGFYPSPYIGSIASGTTIIEIALGGGDLGSSSSSAVTSKSPDIGYDGNLIDPCATYMIITSSSSPKIRIDGVSDASTANGVINSTGNHTTDWVLYDSVSYMDDDDVDDGENGEFAYGQIIFAQKHGDFSAKHFTTTSATIVNYDTTSDANYILRQGSKTGYTENDWIVSANGSNSSVPNWVLSTTTSKVYPDAFAGWDGIKDVYGALNPTAESLTVNSVELSGEFSIYPNPASDVVNVNSSSVDVVSVEVYDILGKKVKEVNNGKVDVSNLVGGVYVLKVNTEEGSFNKRIIVE